jgi:hypothetical protein
MAYHYPCRLKPRSLRIISFLSPSMRDRQRYSPHRIVSSSFGAQRILTDVLTPWVIDRCLQTSKPVAIALRLPIFVEHGTLSTILVPFIEPNGRLTHRYCGVVRTRRKGYRPSSTPRFRLIAPNLLLRNQPFLVLRVVPLTQRRGRYRSPRSHRWVLGRLYTRTREAIS